MQTVICSHLGGAKRGLQSEPKRLRSSLLHGAVLPIEGVQDADEDMDINVDVDDSSRPRWQNRRAHDSGYLGDTDNLTDTATSSKFDDRTVHTKSDILSDTSSRKTSQAPDITGRTATSIRVSRYVFTGTHVTIYFSNDKCITKRRAHTNPYIASLGLSLVVLRRLDDDPRWNVVFFESSLIVEAKRRFSKPEIQKQWIGRRLSARVGVGDI